MVWNNQDFLTAKQIIFLTQIWLKEPHNKLFIHFVKQFPTKTFCTLNQLEIPGVCVDLICCSTRKICKRNHCFLDQFNVLTRADIAPSVVHSVVPVNVFFLISFLYRENLPRVTYEMTCCSLLFHLHMRRWLY